MKQYLETYSQFINEEMINSSGPAIYRNPKSIRKLGPWARALSDIDGNLFIMEDSFQMVHEDLAQWLLDNNKIDWATGGISDFYEQMMHNTVLWQQVGDQNLLYLSESYTQRKFNEYSVYRWTEHIKELTQRVKKRNPGMKYIRKRIYDVWKEPDFGHEQPMKR